MIGIVCLRLIALCDAIENLVLNHDSNKLLFEIPSPPRPDFIIWI